MLYLMKQQLLIDFFLVLWAMQHLTQQTGHKCLPFPPLVYTFLSRTAFIQHAFRDERKRHEDQLWRVLSAELGTLALPLTSNYSSAAVLL